MADFVRSFRDGLLTLVDGTTPTAVSLIVLDAVGDLKFTLNRQVVEILRRGALEDIKRGDQAPIEWSSTFKFRGVEGVPLADTTLRTAAGSGDTSLSLAVGTGAGFASSGEGLLGPENGASVDQEPERFTWSGKSTDTLTGVTRGTNGTTAKSWANGARVRQLDLAARTVLEFVHRLGGYAGLVSTRDTTDVFTFDLWASWNDVAGSVEEAVSLNDAFVLKSELGEGADFDTITLSGKAWAVSAAPIALP